MANSIQGKCIDAVQTVIQDLNLTDLADAQVYKRKLPTDRGLTLPCVVVSYPPDTGETVANATNERADIGYPVMITILVPENQDLAIDTDSDKYDLWREKILLKFHDQRLSGVTEVHSCQVEPRGIVHVEEFVNKNLFCGAMLVRCIARRPRTA